MKQKISFIAPALMGNGGTETVLLHILQSPVILKKFEIELVLIDVPDNTEWLSHVDSNVTIIIFNSNKSRLLQLVNFLRKKSTKDIVIGLGPKVIFLAKLISLAFQTNTKVVSWIHFTLFGSDNLNPKYLKFGDGHLLISSQMINQFLKLNVPKEKLRVIYNPVIAPHDNELILPVVTNTYELVYVGRIMLDGQKNMRYMLEGLYLLALEGQKIRLHLFGRGNEVEVKEYIKEKFRGVEDAIEFIWYGWVNEPFSEIKRADALLLTSKYEGFGMVVAESILRGLPVIATDYPVGVRDLIVPGENGEIIDYNRPNEICLAIKRVREYSNEMRKKMPMTLNFLEGRKYDYNFISAIESLNIYWGRT